MPYKLKKKRNEPLYWVITIETGKKHSKDPIPKEKAKAQMRILKTALRGKGDEGEDDEMARLMEPEPVAFAPAPAANPFAGFFEPRMLRVRARRQARKRAISTVQGALMSNAEKRQKTSHGLRGGITLNEFDDLLQAYARKYSDYDDIKEKTEEDLQKMLKYTKKFFNILKSNLNTNQWNNPRLMQLIDSLDSLEKDQLRKLKNGEELKLDENGKYTEIVDLIYNTKMDDEKETDILANSSGRVGNPTRNPPKEFPPVPVKRLSKGDGKNYCKKCGLPRR